MVRVSFDRNVTRTFNGKRFRVSVAYSTKREAEAKKENLQIQGYSVRTLEIDGKYVLFTRRTEKKVGCLAYKRRPAKRGTISYRRGPIKKRK